MNNDNRPASFESINYIGHLREGTKYKNVQITQALNRLPRTVVPIPLDDGINGREGIYGANIVVRNSLGILFRKTIFEPSRIAVTKNHISSIASDLVDQVLPLSFEMAIPQRVCLGHTQRNIFEFSGSVHMSERRKSGIWTLSLAAGKSI